MFRRALCWMACYLVLSSLAMADERPNVLFIAIDDQNDWVEPLGGHPLVKTPALNRLAARGTTFTNAHCNAPLCNPSRTSLLVGLRPSTTGVYGLAPSFRQVEALTDRVTLPQHFAQAGYTTLATGKIFHGGPSSGNRTAKGSLREPDFQISGKPSGVGPRPPRKLVGDTPMGNNPLVDWGVWPTDNDDTNKGDYQVASWTIDQLRTLPRDKPFFLAAGFFLPHVPCYATQKWFDPYPDDDSLLPLIPPDDRNDVPRFAWYLHWRLPEPRLKWLRDNNQHRNLVRSYLACTSFIDAQIDRILVALDELDLAKNTIIVLWSDHGWHLGEKGITGKNSLWERSTRVPLMFAGPGIATNSKCSQPVELLDIYPTLIALTGIKERDDLEGISLVPQLQTASAPRTRPAITTHNQGNHAVRSERWRFIQYVDGSEELYDMESDPHEWKNLAGDAKYDDVLQEHRSWLPKTNAPPVAGSAQRILTYNAQTGVANWEGEEITAKSVVPE